MKKPQNNSNIDRYRDVDTINLEPQGGGISGLLARRSFEKALRDDTMEALEERHDAMMAKNVLEHAGMLSLMEARMGQELPQARERFRVIVDVYTIKALKRMEGR